MPNGKLKRHVSFPVQDTKIQNASDATVFFNESKDSPSSKINIERLVEIIKLAASASDSDPTLSYLYDRIWCDYPNLKEKLVEGLIGEKADVVFRGFRNWQPAEGKAKQKKSELENAYHRRLNFLRFIFDEGGYGKAEIESIVVHQGNNNQFEVIGVDTAAHQDSSVTWSAIHVYAYSKEAFQLFEKNKNSFYSLVCRIEDEVAEGLREQADVDNEELIRYVFHPKFRLSLKRIFAEVFENQFAHSQQMFNENLRRSTTPLGKAAEKMSALLKGSTNKVFIQTVLENATVLKLEPRMLGNVAYDHRFPNVMQSDDSSSAIDAINAFVLSAESRWNKIRRFLGDRFCRFFGLGIPPHEEVISAVKDHSQFQLQHKSFNDDEDDFGGGSYGIPLRDFLSPSTVPSPIPLGGSPFLSGRVEGGNPSPYSTPSNFNRSTSSRRGGYSRLNQTGGTEGGLGENSEWEESGLGDNSAWDESGLGDNSAWNEPPVGTSFNL